MGWVKVRRAGNVESLMDIKTQESLFSRGVILNARLLLFVGNWSSVAG